MFIDTHAHLNMPDYDTDREEVIANAQNDGVEAIIDVGFDLDSSRRSLEMFSNLKNIYSAIGIHPHDSEKLFNQISVIKGLAQKNKVVAIGEIGLDYHYLHSSKETQKRAFIQQIEIAVELKLPLIIHIREAQDDAMEILKNYEGSKLPAVFHCFSGDQRYLEYVLSCGYHVSFAGPVTFPKAQASRDLLKTVPIDRLLLETDCPYLAPVPLRGKRNQPGYIKLIAIKIAETKSISIEEVASRTTQNAKWIFKI